MGPALGQVPPPSTPSPPLTPSNARFPQAMAAQVVYPERRIVCVLGDSSFGFSGMEVETLCRCLQCSTHTLLVSSRPNFTALI
jgi:hypothetical protein